MPFNSESLVTGKLFEDIRDAVHEMADPEKYDTIVVTNLCVPTASGVPLQLLPDSINGVRIIGIVATETYARGMKVFLADDMGMPCVFLFQRNAGVKPDNAAVKQAIASSSPLIVFGSYNKRMYMAKTGSRSIYINASFPGAAIRRHTGTPFMGYSGCTWIRQAACNALFDSLFFILPLSTMMGKADATPSRLLEAVTWNDDARTELDRLVDKEPVLVRISAAKRLRDAARLYEAQAA